MIGMVVTPASQAGRRMHAERACRVAAALFFHQIIFDGVVGKFGIMPQLHLLQ
jgi:hypothetical protein